MQPNSVNQSELRQKQMYKKKADWIVKIRNNLTSRDERETLKFDWVWIPLYNYYLCTTL